MSDPLSSGAKDAPDRAAKLTAVAGVSGAAVSLPERLLGDVKAALSIAAAMPDEGGTPGRVHAARSRNFVGALAGRLRSAYQKDPDVAVLSKHFNGNRERFGLNELLFDVLVCRTQTTRSANGARLLTFVTGGILAVESEFERDSRQAIFDFNKLVLCASECKLFIGPRVPDEKAFLEPLGRTAAHCGGSVFTVLAPHPSEWKAGKARDVSGYRWSKGVWTALLD